MDLVQFENEHLDASGVRLFVLGSGKQLIQHLASCDQLSTELLFQVSLGLSQCLSGVLLIFILRDYHACWT